MSYELRIKGRNNLVVVSNDIGKKLIAKWEDYKRSKSDSVIEVNGWIGSISDIRDFTFAADNASSKSNQSEKVNAEYMADLTTARQQSPEKRAQSVGFFSFFFFAYTGEQPTQEEKQKAIGIQTEFFTKNPKRIICDPLLFKELIKRNRSGFTEKEGMRKLPVIPAILKNIQNIVAQDIFATRYL